MSCNTCLHLGIDSAGGDYSPSFPVCELKPQYTYLKSFPFKKKMRCWQLNFWHSRFTDIMFNSSGSYRVALAYWRLSDVDGNLPQHLEDRWNNLIKKFNPSATR